jgi:hypothetical protein
MACGHHDVSGHIKHLLRVGAERIAFTRALCRNYNQRYGKNPDSLFFVGVFSLYQVP